MIGLLDPRTHAARGDGATPAEEYARIARESLGFVRARPVAQAVAPRPEPPPASPPEPLAQALALTRTAYSRWVAERLLLAADLGAPLIRGRKRTWTNAEAHLRVEDRRAAAEQRRLLWAEGARQRAEASWREAEALQREAAATREALQREALQREAAAMLRRQATEATWRRMGGEERDRAAAFVRQFTDHLPSPAPLIDAFGPLAALTCANCRRPLLLSPDTDLREPHTCGTRDCPIPGAPLPWPFIRGVFTAPSQVVREDTGETIGHWLIATAPDTTERYLVAYLGGT